MDVTSEILPTEKRHENANWSWKNCFSCGTQTAWMECTETEIVIPLLSNVWNCQGNIYNEILIPTDNATQVFYFLSYIVNDAR